jgi:uncharacterized membrane protein required for colicin V production
MEFSFNLSLLFDLVLLIVVGCFIFGGSRKGTIPTFLSFIILCIAYPLACFLFPRVASLFDQKTTERILNDTVAFATVLVCLYLLIILLVWGILAGCKRFYQDIADYLAGGLAGLLKGVTCIFIIILLAITLLPARSAFIKNSLLSRSALSIVNAIARPFPSLLKKKFGNKKEELELFWRETEKKN